MSSNIQSSIFYRATLSKFLRNARCSLRFGNLLIRSGLLAFFHDDTRSITPYKNKLIKFPGVFL